LLASIINERDTFSKDRESKSILESFLITIRV
jgi:hypothetical protein